MTARHKTVDINRCRAVILAVNGDIGSKGTGSQGKSSRDGGGGNQFEGLIVIFLYRNILAACLVICFATLH